MSLRRILVVDDDPLFVAYLGAALREAGYSPATATESWSAMQLVHEFAPEIAIVDYCLPGGNGLLLLETMRQMRPQIAGVLVTGCGSEGLAFRSGRLGLAAYLAKPFEIEELLNVIAGMPAGQPDAGNATQGLRPVLYAMRRVANRIVRVALAEDDIRTIREWGRLVGIVGIFTDLPLPGTGPVALDGELSMTAQGSETDGGILFEFRISDWRSRSLNSSTMTGTFTMVITAPKYQGEYRLTSEMVSASKGVAAVSTGGRSDGSAGYFRPALPR